jgi:hypothetical protein
LDEQALQTPSMQARPPLVLWGNWPDVLQSAKVEHGPHTPATQAWPVPQSVFDWQVPHSAPNTQPCPGRQSAGVEHEQVPDWQFAPEPGPH